MGKADNDETPDAGAYEAQLDDHIAPSGARVPTPDPKDQTGDPNEPNPAMAELRKRKSARARGGTK